MKYFIDGVLVKKLQINADSRGMLFEILRSDEEMFQKFGQVYVTTALPGVVKAWHLHRIQHDFFTCVSGVVKLVLYDPREDAKTLGVINEFVIGVRNPLLVKIPPGVYHGFMNIGEGECVMLNVPTEAYNRSKPDEERIAWDDPSIQYQWGKRNG